MVIFSCLVSPGNITGIHLFTREMLNAEEF